MQDPVANGTAVTGAGGISPVDPTLSYLDPLALSGYPYIYLIPVGTDSMRSPPLGDASVIRTWTVNDVAIPLPFNIGGSDFSTKQLWQSSDSLTEALFAVRKHQAFRPVATTTAFNSSLYTGSGSLQRSQYNEQPPDRPLGLEQSVEAGDPGQPSPQRSERRSRPLHPEREGRETSFHHL